MRVLKSKKGMTLVEVIVSTALFSLIGIFVMTVFSGGFSVVNNEGKTKQDDLKAIAGLEQQRASETVNSSIASINEENGKFYVNFGGNQVEVNGTYIKAEDKDKNSQYNYFTPKD